MKWDRGTQNDDVVDVRGKRSIGAPHIAGGSVGLLIIGVIISRLLGVDVTGLFSGGGTAATSGQSASNGPGPAAPLDGNDPDAELFDFIKFVMKNIQTTFAAELKAQGRPYHNAKLYVFTDAVDTACGHAGADVGPFYCPGDWNAYIDLSFYKELKKRFGAPGDFAQAYVLAHEIGHHIQNLTREEGKEPKPRAGETKNQYSVRVELQADCYAGVWGSKVKGQKLLEEGDIDEALTAATAIGDDHLQKDAGMQVRPESFTHGTSAQRVAWFRRGFDGGTLASCDTFSTPTL